MKIYSTKFKGLKIIKLKKFNDFRGDIVKIFNKENNKINFKFSESYISISKKGTIRGLHGQMGKYSQSKIIFCIQGKFLDIAIDLRKSSTTYKKIFKRIVHSKNSTILVIPEGFAHGIISLEDQTILINFN